MKKSSKRFAYQEKSITATYLEEKRIRNCFHSSLGDSQRGMTIVYIHFDKSVDFSKS